MNTLKNVKYSYSELFDHLKEILSYSYDDEEESLGNLDNFKYVHQQSCEKYANEMELKY